MARKKTAEPSKAANTTLQKQVEDFKKKDGELKRRGYYPMGVYTYDEERTPAQIKIDSAMTNNYASNAKVAGMGTFVSTSKSRTPVMVPHCGAEGRGYIRTGKDDMMYVNIQNAAKSLPYTASILRFIIDLLCGGGSELRYRYVVVNGDNVEEKSCKFEDAEYILDKRIAELRKMKEEEGRDSISHVRTLEGGGLGKSLDSTGNEGDEADAFGNGGEDRPMTVGMEPMGYRVAKKPEPAVDAYKDKNYEEVGTLDYMLERAIEDKREWERSMEMWKTLKENSTDLDVLLRQWASDQSYFGLGYLQLALERGAKGSWGNVEKSVVGYKLTERPKIIGVSYVPCVCCRMEEQSDELRIENIYYSEKFRYEGTIKDQLRDIVSFNSIMPEHRKDMLERIIINNQSTAPADRKSVVMPIYIPQFDSPYYPVQDWWSIFASMLYILANTIVGDAVTERRNKSMFSYLIYLNMTWFEKYCADNKFDTDEEKENAKREYLRKISDFLQNKLNNGRIAALESITSADEKNILKSIEIVEVPHTNSKASLEDMELVGNAIFFSFGVHGSMVGSFGKNTSSSSGTQQRELTLLKSCQLMPVQRLYLNAWDFILKWNGMCKQAYMSIKQYDLSTLDASKTGLVERE